MHIKLTVKRTIATNADSIETGIDLLEEVSIVGDLIQLLSDEVHLFDGQILHMTEDGTVGRGRCFDRDVAGVRVRL